MINKEYGISLKTKETESMRGVQMQMIKVPSAWGSKKQYTKASKQPDSIKHSENLTRAAER